ncbi:DUF1566 domain-containing protein [Photobacterium kishitanii]|uniref:Lcl domain-containing protein n=1 Tax=Photobacterium kishitanii TaxID=318456 RepID=UPI000D156302|nr:DUF1566 domain-containing protein [Photobacterium kishitanii]PSV09236.1 hypothetical protein C0W28_20530 [Photobacterium kishitanii]
MNYKISIIGSFIALALVGCNSGSSDSSTATTTSGSTQLNYKLQGELANSSEISNDISVCVDLDGDLSCSEKDINTVSTRGDFSLQHNNTELLTQAIVVSAKSSQTSEEFRLLIPAANNYPEHSILSIAPVSTLIYGLMNRVSSPLSFLDAVNKMTLLLQKTISPQITDLNNIALGDAVAQKKYELFNHNLIQYFIELNRLNNQNYITTISQLGEHLDELVPAFVSNNAQAIKTVKDKIRQQQLTIVGSNDTGVTSYLVDGKLQSYPSEEYPGQDAQYGLDRAGVKGFKLIKLDNKGNELPPSAPQWTCVEDGNTGLIWEVKIDDVTSPRDKNRLFAIKASGYTPNQGDIAAATCSTDSDSSMCNTQQYEKYLNQRALCGKKNWRLPTASEQFDLLDLGAAKVQPNLGITSGMDLSYFPNMIKGDWGAGWYWNSSRAISYYENVHFIGLDQLGDTTGHTDASNLILCPKSVSASGKSCEDANTLPVRMVASKEY